MKKTCLVVDDSAVVRKKARQMLEDMGFSCYEAEDGAQAAGFCQTLMPDLMLLDWNMPVMDGLSFVKILRGMPGGMDVRVIFCTTENEMPKIAQALDAGADEYIMKPFDSGILRGKIEFIGGF
jgi:two-component system chemotaxis response regulator CheY